MVLIIGGAYQGKLDFARGNFDIKSVSDCSGGESPSFDTDAIYGIDGFVMECVKSGEEPADFFRENRKKWEDKILIITDISQGIVPIDATQRTFREANGRLMLYLAKEATEVYSVFCGLGRREK